jgi:hypothetical protein
MIDIGTLTLYREKSVVHRVEELNAEEEDGAAPPALIMRSNRITIPVKTAVSTVPCVVRGQNIPGTMRMAAVVIDEIRRDANALKDPDATDWESLWRRKVSKFENDYNRQNWVSVHIAGECVFMGGEGREGIVEVEALAMGEDVTEAIVNEAAANVLGALEDLMVEHDSQTAVVFTPGTAYHRAAILERRDRKTGAFSVSAHHPTPQKPVRLAAFVSFCADINEALTHKAFLDRVQELIAENALAGTNITPALTQATRNRRRELIEAIERFEDVAKISYRPERPNFA